MTDSNTSSSSEERDNSSDSTMSSLTTPVRRRPGIPTMFYVAPTMTGTSASAAGTYAARVPLPPSTGAMVGGLVPGGVGGDGGGGLDAFGGLDFGAGLGDFDPSLFNGDASINFERDFAAWFDPENA